MSSAVGERVHDETATPTVPRVSDTIFPPSNTVPAGFNEVSYDEMREISLDTDGRTTVAIERTESDEVSWWLTAWAATTADGEEVYCFGSSGQGVSCMVDHGPLTYPVQIAGFATEPPAAVVLVAARDVTALSVSVNGDEVDELGLAPIGLPSGLQAAGLAFDARPGAETRLEVVAEVEGAPDYGFAVDLPRSDEGILIPAMPSEPVNPLNSAYAPVELLTQPD